jgi:hypothetical protein
MNLGLSIDGKATNDFPTKDIYLAAAIKAKGAKLVRIDKRERMAVFVFDNTPELKETVTAYMNHELVHEVHDLFESWRSLKSLMYSILDNVR